jgi:uncharacterized membrane protein YecN with MAPEG domain
MQLPTLLSITPIYVAVLGLIFIPITMRVGYYRVSNKINLGDGGDQVLLRIVRGQANFVETVPLVAIMLVLMELAGAPASWLHSVGGLLVGGRVLHYLALTEMGPLVGRPIGMFATMGSYLAASGWLLYHFL